MRCPECGLEQEAHAKRCARCGIDLTYTALTAGEHHRTEQVWNTDIDTDRNKRNTRAAMIAAAVGVLLTVVLVLLLVLWLPRGLSFSMPSISLPDVDIAELLEDIFEADSIQARPEPEPEAPPARALYGADLDFINVFAAYVIELSYIEDTEQQRELHQMFYPEFEYLCGEEYDYEQLENAAWDVAFLTAALADPETDRVEWLQSYHELSTLALTLNEGFYFLDGEQHTLNYLTAMQRYMEARLEVEYDLQAQLWGAGTAYDQDFGCQVVYYTNNTPYYIDVIFYNDFVTEDMHYSDSYGLGGMMPGTTEGIPLYALEEIGAQDHTWHMSWEVEALYLDGEPLEPWDIVIDSALGVWGR